MTVNSYLTHISNGAIVRDSEKESINKSIRTLKERMNQYFGSEITDHFKFGSSKRDTMLPRKLDENSDVDYMTVFKGDNHRPQTYLDKLRRFASSRYSSSQIKQSNPTIILSLNHIHFELVPAVETFWRVDNYRIPDKASSYNDWVSTSPLVLETDLRMANKEHDFLVKPMVRLMKYWNASNGYPFQSYGLEENILKQFHVNPFMALNWLPEKEKLEDYLYQFVSDWTLGWGVSDLKKNKLDKLKKRVKSIQRLKRDGLEDEAVDIAKRIFSPLN